MSDINLTQLHATGFIPVPSDAISASADNQNTGMTRDTKETGEHFHRERLLAQIWPPCWLSADLGKSFQVAQATRLYRPATRRTELKRRFEVMRTIFSQQGSGQFRSASRRARRASRPRHPFSKH